MTSIIKHIFLAMVVVTSFDAGVRARQSGRVHDQLPQFGELRGIASQSASSSTLVAAWYWVEPVSSRSGHSLLVVFELESGRYRELYVLQGNGFESWEHLAALPRGLAGFVIETSDGITDHDGDFVLARVGDTFAVVFKGSTSEIADLNADGLPEILESSWPDGDGFPKTTRVHVFDRTKYVPAGDVPFRERFGSRSTKLASSKPVAKAQPN